MMSVQQALVNGLAAQAILYLRGHDDYVTITPVTPVVLAPGDILWIATFSGEITMTNETDTTFTPFFEESDLL